MATASAGIYRPRHPERTALYRVFAQHFERFVQVYDERFAPRRGPLPPGAQEAVNRYLDCGIFACGFARVAGASVPPAVSKRATPVPMWFPESVQTGTLVQ